MSHFNELTLSILKPHLVKNPWASNNVRTAMLNNGFKIVENRTLTLTTEVAEKFYEEHRNKFFFNRLISFISSGPVEAYILSRKDAIGKWRRLMGPTKVYTAVYSEPDSLRGLYGLSDTRNATHGSDSRESAMREIQILFPNFSVEKWIDEERY